MGGGLERVGFWELCCDPVEAETRGAVVEGVAFPAHHVNDVVGLVWLDGRVRGLGGGLGGGKKWG